VPPNLARSVVREASRTARVLAMARGRERDRGVAAMARAITDSFDDILEANTLDLETSRDMAVPELVQDWLKLTPERLQAAVEILRHLATVPDPLRRVTNAPYQLDPAQTYSQQRPLGTIALVYEAFPELGAIAAGLCLKTGNCLVLRGGPESSHSNAAIAEALQQGLAAADLPPGALQLLPCEESSLTDLLAQDEHVNLVIPYGRPDLVQQAVQCASVPVLRSAIGNCYLYLSNTGDIDLASHAIADSHASKPDPVNAIEKVVVHAECGASALRKLFHALEQTGFQLRGDESACQEFPSHLRPAAPHEWSATYLDRIVAFRRAADVSEAIDWIDRHSSGHADCAITESYLESRQFANGVDSALVYVNASPRFERYSPRGGSVFLGMSNQKGYRRGPIGLDSLTAFKQVVQGDGS